MLDPKEPDLRNTYNPNLKEIQESTERAYSKANYFYKNNNVHTETVIDL